MSDFVAVLESEGRLPITKESVNSMTNLNIFFRRSDNALYIMRQPRAAPIRAVRKGGSYSVLLIIILFSGCLLFGFMYNSHSHHRQDKSYSSTQTKLRLDTGGKGTAGSSIQKSTGIEIKEHAGTMAQRIAMADAQSKAVRGGRLASTAGTVAETDPRHPKNIAKLLSEQSSHDEHKSKGVNQHSNSSVHVPVAANVTSSASAAKSSSNTQLNKHESASGQSNHSKATEVSSGVKGRADSMAHATEHLKEVAALLKQVANQTNQAAAVNGTQSVTVSPIVTKTSNNTPKEVKVAATPTAVINGTTSTAGILATPKTATVPASSTGVQPLVDATTVKSNITAVGKVLNTEPPPDLLAYSKAQNHPGDTIHTLFTSNGSPYQNIQARIMVGTWNLMRKMPGGEKHVAMTRILHRQTPDEVMEEIPSFRADPLQPECDKWCWFPVADRANAVQQWINAAHKDHSLIKAPWLLLLETDYVWVKPLQAIGSAYDLSVPGMSYRFDYMAPQHYIVAEILKEKCPDCDPKLVTGSGPAPVLARFSDFRAATPLWEELSLWIETHEHAKKQLGWVREMYAWDIGVAAHKLNIQCQGQPHSQLISQPPHDTLLNNATMYHYTWGTILKDKDMAKEIWKFDKRFYTEAKDALKVPNLPLPPPWEDGLHIHDGMPWTKDLHATLTDMLTHMNRAIDTLPNLLEKPAKTPTA